MTRRGAGFWWVQVPGWLLFAYLVYAQAIPAFNYDLGVAMGTQESADTVTQVGVAFWYGLAVGDVVVYIPLLAAGLIGHWFGHMWGRLLLAAALGITIYWPITSLVAVAGAHGAEGWSMPSETTYWIVLPVIALWAAVALWQVIREGSGLAQVDSTGARWFGQSA